jgi:hypothetical protein
MTEILSEAEIDECLENLRIFEKLSFIQAKKALNTIKLQRQQLAEQERKVWNEAIEAVLALVEVDQHPEWGGEELVEPDDIRALLKPESEVSGD